MKMCTEAWLNIHKEKVMHKTRPGTLLIRRDLPKNMTKISTIKCSQNVHIVKQCAPKCHPFYYECVATTVKRKKQKQEKNT